MILMDFLESYGYNEYKKVGKPEGAKPGTIEEAIARADAALHKAKALGRNQYVLAEDKTLEA